LIVFSSSKLKSARRR